MRYLRQPLCCLEDKKRFWLGTSGEKTLVVFGLNPSTATRIEPDKTIKRVERLANELQFDSWLMLNLCPIIEKKPALLPPDIDVKVMTDNIQKIMEKLKEVREATFCAAWGNDMTRRAYFANSLARMVNEIPQLGSMWHSFGQFTEAGHPWHPLYLKKTHRHLRPFDMQRYLKGNLTIRD